MSLKDIQEMSLEILSYIDNFCTNNNIRYSLGYGSLIGAIRHQGFIPWDDDLDIIMPRPDYEKFYKLFNALGNKQYKLFAPEINNNNYIISRVCEMKRTRVYKFYAWANEPTGVWVDIFPIDAYPGNELSDQIIECNWQLYYKSLGKAFNSHMTIKQLAVSAITRFTYRKIDIENIRNRYNHLISQLSYENSTYVCNYGSPYKNKDVHNRHYFDSYKRVPFNSLEVTVISDYDKYLRNIYGDYMTPPPVEKQTRGHVKHKYYWRD